MAKLGAGAVPLDKLEPEAERNLLHRPLSQHGGPRLVRRRRRTVSRHAVYAIRVAGPAGKPKNLIREIAVLGAWLGAWCSYGSYSGHPVRILHVGSRRGQQVPDRADVRIYVIHRLLDARRLRRENDANEIKGISLPPVRQARCSLPIPCSAVVALIIWMRGDLQRS